MSKTLKLFSISLVLFVIAFRDAEADVLRFETYMDRSVKQPPFWREVPNTLWQFPSNIQDGTLIDPWNYKHRLGLLRILMRNTRQYQRFANDNSGNSLWELPLQLGWQFSSGRLANYTTKEGCGMQKQFCISPFSWWSGMNYYLSVLPFLGAQKAGYFNDWSLKIAIFYPSFNANLFCVDQASCEVKTPKALQKWTKYFKMLKTVKSEEELLAYQWDAQEASIEAALPLMKDLVKNSTEEEKQFGLNLAHFVAYVGASYVRTDMNTTYGFQQLYLPKVLLDKDTSVPTTVARGLKLLHRIRKIDSYTDNALLKFWKRVTCSRRGRKYVMDTMTKNVDSDWQLLRDLSRLAWLSLWEKCDRPSL